jgi:membrane dipeptidase
VTAGPPAPIVDAHLDLAYNVLAGRDYDLTASDVQAVEDVDRGRCMVTLRELERGDVAVAFATLYTGTNSYDADGQGVYRDPPEETARRQLDVYLGWEAEGKARIIRDRTSLSAHVDGWRRDGKLGIVVLIEGGDSITSPEALPAWFDAGVRIIGPAWSATRYCGGTRRPGGLTAAGRELVAGMRELGIVLDTSHLAEESFWDALDVGPGRIIASHSNARELVPGGYLITGDRQLSDEMIRAIGSLDGVIGLNLFNGFLTPQWEHALLSGLLCRVLPGPPLRRIANFVALDAVRAHAEHIAALIGWERVGIGSDLDGGLGVDETPKELDSAADLHRVAEVAPPEARAGVLGENWLRFLAAALPA